MFHTDPARGFKLPGQTTVRDETDERKQIFPSGGGGGGGGGTDCLALDSEARWRDKLLRVHRHIFSFPQVSTRFQDFLVSFLCCLDSPLIYANSISTFSALVVLVGVLLDSAEN